MKATFYRVKSWVQKYERHLSSGALITGFIVDLFTFQRIDLPLGNFILISYLILAGSGIFLLNLYMGGGLRARIFEKICLFIPFIIQYALGGLFSGFVLFYSRSGALSTSWPFLLILVGMLVGNEMFRKYYERLIFQISIYFFTLFLFLIFYIPILVGRLGAWVFLLSGVASLILMGGFMNLLRRAAPFQIEKNKNFIMGAIGGIFVLINVLYFANIIPPIPLSLKDGGMYHSIVASGEGYTASQENDTRCFFCILHTYSLAPGQPIYAYSAVFAPTDLKTNIVHHWEHYDENAGKWKSSGRVEFPISGGRDEGFRGYSVKSNLLSGLWRVNVETPRGQVIGRIKFKIRRAEAPPELESGIQL